MEAARALRRRLGLLLVEKGILSREELDLALTEQRRTRELLGNVLIRLGLASRPAIQDALAEQAGVLFEPDSGFGTGLRGEIARRHVERRTRRVRRASAELVALPGGLPADEPDEPRPVAEAPVPVAEPEAPVAPPQEQAPEEAVQAAEIEPESSVARAPEPIVRLAPELEAPELPEDATRHLLFFRGIPGYQIVEVDGPAPEVGDRVMPPGAEHPFAVLKLGASPLPSDPRACAFLEPPPR